MPLPVIDDTFQCAMRYGTDFWYAVNVFNLQSSETNLELIAFNLGEEFWKATSIADMLSATVALSEIAVTPYDNASGATVFAAGALGLSNEAGLASGEVESPQVSGVITWRTPLGGRSFRGRSYIAGFSTAMVDSVDGTLSSLGDSTWQPAVDTFIDGMNTNLAGFELQVVSLYSGVDEDGKPIPREIPVTTGVTSWVARSALRTQRNRASRVP